MFCGQWQRVEVCISWILKYATGAEVDAFVYEMNRFSNSALASLIY